LPESIAVALHNAVVRKFRLFSDHVTRFIMPSDFSARWLIEQGGMPEQRVAALYPIVQMPETLTDPAEGTYVAYAGRFAPEKGVNVLIEATKVAGLPLHMSGDSQTLYADQPHVQHVAAENGSELAAFYRGARILAIPSVWHEVFGIVAAEAMAHGVPVVAARVGGLADLVEDGKTGLLFEPGNVGELAEKLTALWNDPERCRELGRRGHDRISQMCDREGYFRKLMAIYEEAVAVGPYVPGNGKNGKHETHFRCSRCG